MLTDYKPYTHNLKQLNSLAISQNERIVEVFPQDTKIQRHYFELLKNEIDLREMLNNARNRKVDVVEGRWIIETRHERHPWQVIVEPDAFEKLLLVITAYPVWD